jgi:MFS family permease
MSAAKSAVTRPVASQRDARCADHLDVRIERRPAPHPARQARAFWLVALVFTVILLGTTLPAPLYVVFQGEWGFSAGVLTVIFAAYSAGVVAALLLFGRVSDEAGRRRVLFTALGVAIASTAVFVVAGGVATLLLARVLSGLAAGLTQGTATAALAELEPNHDVRRAALTGAAVTSGAVGLGPLLGGFFAEYLGWKAHLVFVFYLVLLGAAVLAMLFVPETVEHPRRPAIRMQRLSVPSSIRAPFLSAALAIFSAFALIGLFVSLVPSFLGLELHQHNHAVAGFAVFAFFACATAAQLALHGVSSRRAMLVGTAVLFPGLALLMLGLDRKELAIFGGGTACCGVGAGLVIMGSLASVNRIAPPEHRGETLSSFFVAAYLGLAIPAICVGIVSERTGFFRATLGCSIAIAALLTISVLHLLGERRGES